MVLITPGSDPSPRGQNSGRSTPAGMTTGTAAGEVHVVATVIYNCGVPCAPDLHRTSSIDAHQIASTLRADRSVWRLSALP